MTKLRVLEQATTQEQGPAKHKGLEDYVRLVKGAFVPLVRACAAIQFIRFLEEIGTPVDRYLADAKLSAVPVDNPENLVSLLQVLRFLNRAAADEGIENLGLLVGERTEIADLGILGRVVQRSVTLNTALATAAAAIACFNSGERIWLAPENDRVLICHALVVSGDEARHGHLFAIMLLIKLVRLFAGMEWRPREIRLPKAELMRRTFYEASLRTIVAFHEPPIFAVVVEPPLLACARAQTASRETPACDDMALWRSSAPATDLPGSLCQAVRALLPYGYPDIRVVADSAGMTVRSLQRRLAEEGESYSHLVARARFELAVRLLRDGHVKLIDIGYELGYSDPANFTRAFRQWTGVAPSRYRRMARMGEIFLVPAGDAATHRDRAPPRTVYPDHVASNDKKQPRMDSRKTPYDPPSRQGAP